MKRLAAGALLALGMLGGARAALGRRRAQQLRLDVYYDDGAMLSLPPTRATEALRAAEAA